MFSWGEMPIDDLPRIMVTEGDDGDDNKVGYWIRDSEYDENHWRECAGGHASLGNVNSPSGDSKRYGKSA
jgi:hypothetical protein